MTLKHNKNSNIIVILGTAGEKNNRRGRINLVYYSGIKDLHI